MRVNQTSMLPGEARDKETAVNLKTKFHTKSLSLLASEQVEMVCLICKIVDWLDVIVSKASRNPPA